VRRPEEIGKWDEEGDQSGGVRRPARVERDREVAGEARVVGTKAGLRIPALGTKAGPRPLPPTWGRGVEVA
jgi:hypothetical protein